MLVRQVVVLLVVLVALSIPANTPVQQIYIPAINVNAAVLAVSDPLYLPDGSVTWDLSDIGDQVGWLDPALFPESGPGNLVLVGHRTIPSGMGAFYDLDRLGYGDFVYFRRDVGTTIGYRVIQTFVVDGDDMTVVRDYGDNRLTLITCIGEGYAQRRVVVAELLGPVICREPGVDGQEVPCF